MDVKINDRLILKQFSINQADSYFQSIHAQCDADDLYRMKLQKKHKTLSDTVEIIRDAVENKFLIDGTPDFFIYFESKIIGVFEFAPLQENVDYLEVGYWLFLDNRGKGILSTIFPFMINYGKTHFNCSRLIATTEVDNIPSQKLLEKFNFRRTENTEEFIREGDVVEKHFVYEFLMKKIEE